MRHQPCCRHTKILFWFLFSVSHVTSIDRLSLRLVWDMMCVSDGWYTSAQQVSSQDSDRWNCACTVRAHVTSSLHGHRTSTSKHSVFVRFEFSEGKTNTDVQRAVNREPRGKKLWHWSKFIFLFLKLRNALKVSRLRRKVLACSHSGSKSSSNCLCTKHKHGLHGGTGSKIFPL